MGGGEEADGKACAGDTSGGATSVFLQWDMLGLVGLLLPSLWPLGPLEGSMSDGSTLLLLSAAWSPS